MEPWNLDAFRSGLITKLPHFNHIVDELDVSRPESIDTCKNNFTLTIRDVADPLFSKKSRHGRQPHSTMSRNKLCKSAEWFDSGCYNARQLYLRVLNKFNFNKTVETRIDMCSKRTAYKKGVRNKKRSGL